MEDSCCSHWNAHAVERARPYDLWSVGVVWLELILATPHVFSIPQRTQSLMRRALHLSQVCSTLAARHPFV